MKLRSSAGGARPSVNWLPDEGQLGEVAAKVEIGQSETELEVKPEVKEEAMDTSVSGEVGGATLSDSGVKSEIPRSTALTVTSDLTRPLSIETKFSVSPCAASSESTDTASEVGSGFSSPGSLNTSSCQSSPQFSDGTSGTGRCTCLTLPTTTILFSDN